MHFDVDGIRRVRKWLQWSVVPMALIAVLTLSHPSLPLLLCFAALGVLAVAVWVGFVEEQVAESGSSWLWRKVRGLPCEEMKLQWLEKSPTYREPYEIPHPPRVVRRHVHWLTWMVAMMPMAIGGTGLGWRLLRREACREVEVWRKGVVRKVEWWRVRDMIRSSHVGCSGRSCTHCNDLIKRGKEGG
jgi:hypothetical protein